MKNFYYDHNSYLNRDTVHDIYHLQKENLGNNTCELKTENKDEHFIEDAQNNHQP